MALIDEIRSICSRLAQKGWTELLARHGLVLGASNLAVKLAKPLPIDRTLPGFEDFALAGKRAIEPGKPALSLLYHALASPCVHPTSDNRPSSDPSAYPTLEELDAVENYIYSVKRARRTAFPGAVVAVFAYQYRPSNRSPHGVHADMAYSRAGVSRVGTAPRFYDAARRSFWVEPEPGSREIAVMPARFATFLAVSRKPGTKGAVLEPNPDDPSKRFLFPLHKLFPGRECLVGPNLTLEYFEYHRNEKLHRAHKAGQLPMLAGFDAGQPPFFRDSRNEPGLVSLVRAGASVLSVPRHQARLVRTATQRNADSGQDEIVRFKVPKATNGNRFATSFMIRPKDDRRRKAPEYVNIRHEVVRDSSGQFRIEDLSQLSEAQFRKKLKDGGYHAAHFVDDTCDGAITARVTGLGSNISDRAAYSLVAAPDYFPLCDQTELARWERTLPRRAPNCDENDHFAEGGPDPLCNVRMAANPRLVRGDDPSRRAFSLQDTSVAAIVGDAAASQSSRRSRPSAMVSHLPDAASGVFAPGWDVSLDGDGTNDFFAAYGLGSPFPEDAKLCAALNSFWPAAAPDVARTFGNSLDGTRQTAMPLLDRELGFHPDHPRVRAGEVQSAPGWDGEFGPFFREMGGQLLVNYASGDRSDYVKNALEGHLVVQPFLGVNAEELIRRMMALRAAIDGIPPQNDRVFNSGLLLVTVEAVPNWSQRADRGHASLNGPGYVYEFAELTGTEQPTADLRRRERPVARRFICQIGNALLAFAARPHGQPVGPFQAAAIPPLGFPLGFSGDGGD